MSRSHRCLVVRLGLKFLDLCSAPGLGSVPFQRSVPGSIPWGGQIFPDLNHLLPHPLLPCYPRPGHLPSLTTISVASEHLLVPSLVPLLSILHAGMWVPQCRFHRVLPASISTCVPGIHGDVYSAEIHMPLFFRVLLPSTQKRHTSLPPESL